MSLETEYRGRCRGNSGDSRALNSGSIEGGPKRLTVASNGQCIKIAGFLGHSQKELLVGYSDDCLAIAGATNPPN